MIQQNFWLRALNVRAEEGWLVKRLFLLQFFQGAGITFFFTAAFSLFLTRFYITELPYVFIISAFLLWFTGFFYARMEHKYDISKLSIIITLFIALTMVIFRLAFEFIKTDWFLYWMFAWFYVLYLLNNLVFWGQASILFDVRQSKRLFGVISAGDIPAKFIGNSLALLSLTFIDPINLLIAGTICMLASIPFLLSIKKTGKLLELHHHKEPDPGQPKDDLKKILKNFSGNLLIRSLSILSIIIAGGFLIIFFAFYGGVKEAYPDDVSLARFITFFMAFVRICTIIVKMIFTGRLINKLGITKSLLITPMVLLILIAIIIITQDLPSSKSLIIYLFGATYMVVEILKSAINSPVFLTIMQPLSNHERLRAHTILKGIMDPFASLAVGIILLVLIYFQHEISLLTLSYIILIICIGWIIGIYRVNKYYLKTIVKTISSQYFNLENFSISDTRTLDWLKEKTKNGTETEVINVLNMLCSSSQEMSDDLLVAALQHPSQKVKIVTLKLLQQKRFPAAANILLPFLQNNDNPLLVAESIKIMCSNAVDNQIILPYLGHENPEIRKAALAGLFFHGNAQSKTSTGEILKKMLSSEIIGERLMVAEILSARKKCTEVEMIYPLMNDIDYTVRKAAYMAAGKSENKELMQELMNRLEREEIAIIEPLYIAGDFSLPFIVDYINSAKATSLQKEKLILLCGRKGGDMAQQILLNLLTSHPEENMAVVKAIYRSNYSPKPEDQPALFSEANKLLSRSADIIYMQSSLTKMPGKHQLLINAFDLELHGIRRSLLYLFGILYDRGHIKKVRTAYATGKKASILNAMEIIDITVRKDLSMSFNTIFEPGNITERMHSLRNIYPIEIFENVEQVLTSVLSEDTRPYNNWTIACCLYVSKKQKYAIYKSMVQKYTTAENILVRETALFAL